MLWEAVCLYHEYFENFSHLAQYLQANLIPIAFQIVHERMAHEARADFHVYLANAADLLALDVPPRAEARHKMYTNGQHEMGSFPFAKKRRRVVA
jgi:hypothetical protein